MVFCFLLQENCPCSSVEDYSQMKTLHVGIGVCTYDYKRHRDFIAGVSPTNQRVYVRPIDRALLSAFSPVDRAGYRLETVYGFSISSITKFPRLCIELLGQSVLLEYAFLLCLSSPQTQISIINTFPQILLCQLQPYNLIIIFSVFYSMIDTLIKFKYNIPPINCLGSTFKF